MCRVIVHRGPDDEGVHLGEGVGLGMRRLSIIDLAGGHQPVANEDSRSGSSSTAKSTTTASCATTSSAAATPSAPSSDTERSCISTKSSGRAASSGYAACSPLQSGTTRQRQLLLARDRLGIKPLYYADREGELVFGSELKSILQLAHIERTLNWDAVRHLFTFMATPSNQSIVDGVRKLEPGHFAVLREGHRLRTEQYWDVEFTADETATEEELVERLRQLLIDAIAAHRISDVPVGAFLSGGIDPSAVVGLMALASSAPVKTFSVGFREQGFDELRYARKVAARFGTDHHEIVLEPDDIPSMDDLVWYLDEPFGDASAIPTYVVSKLAATQVKVVLTGDGGDELFAGYDKYIVEGRERLYDRVPPRIRQLTGAVGAAMPEGMRGRRFLRHFGLAGSRRYLDASTLFPADEMPNLFRAAAFAQMKAYDPWAPSLSYLRQGGDWISALQIPRSQHVSAAGHPDQSRPHDHGALDRGAPAAPRPPPGRVRCDRPRASPVTCRHHEVLAEAGNARVAAT